MLVHFLTRYGEHAPSSRLRAYQFQEPLRERGWDARVFPLLRDAYVDRLYRGLPLDIAAVMSDYAKRFVNLRSSLRDCDVVVVEKELFPGLPSFLSTPLERGAAPTLVDYDDAVYAGYADSILLREKIQSVIGRADGIIAGNRTLQAFALHYNPCVWYVPTVIDLRRYAVAPSRASPAPVVIGWIGTPVTQVLLTQIAPALASVQAKTGAIVRLIGASETFQLPEVRLEKVAWDAAAESAQLQAFDVGIMPLDDTAWNRGKCGYKLVQYMGIGLPVVASPVGANSDIVEDNVTGYLASTTEEWTSSLSRLVADESLRRRLGAAGRRKAEREFSLSVAADRLVQIFATAAGGSRCAR